MDNFSVTTEQFDASMNELAVELDAEFDLAEAMRADFLERFHKDKK